MKLAHSAKKLGANRLVCVIKNGIKITKINSNIKIWDIVAFLEKVKNMTPEEYTAYHNAISKTNISGTSGNTPKKNYVIKGEELNKGWRL